MFKCTGTWKQTPLFRSPPQKMALSQNRTSYITPYIINPGFLFISRGKEQLFHVTLTRKRILLSNFQRNTDFRWIGHFWVPESHFQNEAKCKTFLVWSWVLFAWESNINDFHINSFGLSLALIQGWQRLGTTQTWPIAILIFCVLNTKYVLIWHNNV